MCVCCIAPHFSPSHFSRFTTNSYKFCKWNTDEEKWEEKASGTSTGDICAKVDGDTINAFHLDFEDLKTAFISVDTKLRSRRNPKVLQP